MVIFGMGDQVCCKVGMGGFLEKVGEGRPEIETFIFLPISLSDEIQDVTYSRIQFENERNAFYKVQKYSLKIQEIQKAEMETFISFQFLFGKKFKM